MTEGSGGGFGSVDPWQSPENPAPPPPPPPPPGYGAPTYAAPTYGAPGTPPPDPHQPDPQQPTYEGPSYGSPAGHEQQTRAFGYEPPPADAASYQQPTYQQPTYQQRYGPQPYDQQPPYGPPHGVAAPYGAGYGYAPPRVGPSGSTIALTIVSGLLTLSCYFTVAGLPALVLAIVALVKNDRDPAGSGQLTRIGWIVLGVVSALIVIGFFVLVGWLGVIASTSGPLPDTSGTY